jgi:molybdate transport system substrate-binding protein
MNAWRAVVLATSTFCLAPLSMAAELQVIAGGGIAAPLKEIAAQFEKATGHKLVIRYGTTPELIKMATTGGPFDLGVVPIDIFRNDAARATFTAGAPSEVARVGIGVAVRAGAPKPDISTPAALKQTLLNAKSIASIPESATGYLLAGIYERLGIAEAMKARIKPQPTPAAIAQSVASSETELGVFLTNVLTAPGIDLVGPFPREVQMEVVYHTSVSAQTKEAGAANAFIAYLKSPAAAAVIKSKGMTPSSL